MDSTVTATVVTGVFSLLVALVAWRTSERARSTKEKTDQNALALEAWQKLIGPMTDELERERRERQLLEVELEEERKVSAALAKQNEQLHSELRHLQGGGDG